MFIGKRFCISVSFHLNKNHRSGIFYEFYRTRLTSRTTSQDRKPVSVLKASGQDPC